MNKNYRDLFLMIAGAIGLAVIFIVLSGMDNEGLFKLMDLVILIMLISGAFYAVFYIYKKVKYR